MTERHGRGRRQEDREIEEWIGRLRMLNRLLLALVGAFPAGVALVITARAAWLEILTAWVRQ